MASLYWRLRVKDGHEKLVGLLFRRQFDVMDREDKSLGTDYSTPAHPELCVTWAKHLTSLSLSLWESIPVQKQGLESMRYSWQHAWSTIGTHTWWHIGRREQEQHLCYGSRVNGHCEITAGPPYPWATNGRLKIPRKSSPQIPEKQNLNLPHAEHCAESVQMK